jgi:hypothetical protein
MRRGIRKSLTRCLLVGLALLLAVPPLPRVQPSAAAAVPLKPQQLEQIVAPIALYPDSLVAHIMMAATYPLEVVQAARFVRANPNLRDDALNDELKKYEWDNSVKALVKFPQVLEMMDGQLEWMQRLGDAVLTQQKEAMDAIQRLRARAQKAGTLKSTQEQKVIVESAPTPTDQTIIKIEPENPEIIYPPAYDPLVVYGPWPYPAYPPYYYYSPYYPLGYATIWFGFGTLVGGSIWGGCNWRVGKFALHVEHHNAFDRHVNRMNVVRPLRVAAGGARGNGVVWQHNPEHRRLVQSRDAGDPAAVQPKRRRHDRLAGALPGPGRARSTGSDSRHGWPGRRCRRQSRRRRGARARSALVQRPRCALPRRQRQHEHLSRQHRQRQHLPREHAEREHVSGEYRRREHLPRKHLQRDQRSW